MTRLEEVKAGAAVRGITPERFVKAVGVRWYGDRAIQAGYEGEDGTVGNRLPHRHDEPALEAEPGSRSWPFDGDGALLRLDAEAMRIRLARLLDPYPAIRTSRVEPLPHQITAVYGEMLRLQPLCLLLTGCPTALFSAPARACS